MGFQKGSFNKNRTIEITDVIAVTLASVSCVVR